MKLWERYLRPTTVSAALAGLSEANGRAWVLAGGTDLLLDMQQGRHPPVQTLVDICQIPEMLVLEEEAGYIHLGAALSHRTIVGSALLQSQSRCLVEACDLIGGPQVRSVATIGGNVAHALPAGDGTIALLALDAEAQIASTAGRRWEPVRELFERPGQPTFDRARELLVSFRFPSARSGEGTAFRRVMRPQGVAIAILNMAAWLRVSGDGRIEAVRLGVGPAGPIPLRAFGTEAALRGQFLTESTIAEASQALLREASLRTSKHRATQSYRTHLIHVLLRRTLEAGYRRATGVLELQ